MSGVWEAEKAGSRKPELKKGESGREIIYREQHEKGGSREKTVWEVEKQGPGSGMF